MNSVDTFIEKTKKFIKIGQKMEVVQEYRQRRKILGQKICENRINKTVKYSFLFSMGYVSTHVFCKPCSFAIFDTVYYKTLNSFYM